MENDGKRDLLDALVVFARRVSDERSSGEILALLAHGLHEHAGADGVAVLAIGEDGAARIRASRGIDGSAALGPFDAAEVEVLGEAVLAGIGSAFVAERSYPLVAGGNLFGVAVLLLRSDSETTAQGAKIIDGLVDLASLALAGAMHVARLERTYEESCVSHDILARAEKLRAFGQMAAGLSHDLRNLLNPLSLHVEVAARALARGDLEELRASLAEVRGGVTRGVETLERLRAYGRQPGRPEEGLVALDVAAREAAEIARPRISMLARGSTVHIVEQLHERAPVVGVHGELVSALVNLVVNAIDAIAIQGERITLRTGEANGGSWVEVEDDGMGMTPDVERQAFEPFFTTKGAGGMGLGLAMVHATVQRHRGKITLSTKEGKGTCFRLWFAAAPAR